MTKKIEHIYEDEVEKKRCCSCQTYQPLENYNSCKGSWDKLRPKCKNCLHLVRMKNKERMTNYNKKYWQKTQESQKIKHKKWRENNVEHRKEYNKKWRMKNGEACDKREWQKRKNDPIHKEKQKRYRIERCKTDPGYKLGFDVRCRIRQALKSIGQGKTKRTVRYLHCTLQELKEYLEVKFKPGMTWNNHGKWHIDHRRPCASFDLTKEEDIKMCFHYTNLQPLWGAENLRKGAKFDPETFNYEWSGEEWKGISV